MEMSKYKIVIPGAVTSLSIFAGMFAIFFCLNESAAASYPVVSCWLVLFAAILDGLDGKVARLTRSSSEFGIQFDSMADIITFGTATSVILYRSFFMKLVQENPLFFAFPMLFLVCGAVRLARFNVTATTKAKSGFTGMPIPVAASTMVSLLLFFNWAEEQGLFIPDHILLRVTAGCVVVVSLLMVSTIHYDTFFGFLFNDWRKHWFRSIVWLVLIVVLFIHPALSFFVIAFFYLFYGIVESIRERTKEDPEQDTIEIQEQP